MWLIRSVPALSLSALMLVSPAVVCADTGGTVTGFGGVTVSGLESQRPSLGGTVTFNLVPELQIVGEVGRIGNVLPSRAETLLSVGQTGLRASAFYGEGGVRTYLGRSAVSPYVEATGGIARVNLRVGGINATIDDLLQLGLGFTNSTSPTAGLGAGVMWQAGRVAFDTGYRYKKIFSQGLVDRLLTSGQQMTSHQVVFGVGVRF